MASNFINSLGADIIHPGIYVRANKLSLAGNIADAYLVLANSGDAYAAAAYQIVNDDNFLGGFDFVVHSSWENNAPGAYDAVFQKVAFDHQRNYLNLIENAKINGRDGNVFYGLPNSFQIENSYLRALAKNGVPAEAALDIMLNTATFGSPQWANILGLPNSRISNQSSVLENMSWIDAAGNLVFGFVGNAWNNTFGNSPTQCFPADTPIQLASGEFAPIQSVRPSDDVASYYGGGAREASAVSDDGNATNIAYFRGRGGSDVPYASRLESRPVVRLFENITDTFIKLSTGLAVTPGHHFLDSKGRFRPIETILADDSKIVLADGTLASVSGEYFHYSAETADMFEQAEGYVAQTVGNVAGGVPTNDNFANHNTKSQPVKFIAPNPKKRAA